MASGRIFRLNFPHSLAEKNPKMRHFLIPIIFVTVLILSVGLVSGMSTNNAYQFKVAYEGLGHEEVTLRLRNGRAKMHYIGYDRYGNVLHVKQFFGVFLRWGDHYYLYQIEQDQASNPQTFNVKNLYIRELENKRSVMVSDQRGLFINQDGLPLQLKGIFYGRSLSRD